MAEQQGGGAPKIIVDSDWKAQAHREREKLAEKERQSREAADKARPASPPSAGPAGQGAAQGRSPDGGPGGELPPADFHTLTGTMVTQALMYMGAFPDPETGRAIVSLEHARFHIDLLAILQEKTKGNLTKEEAEDLAQALNELRMRFVEIIKAIEQMKKEGKLKVGGAPGAMGAPAGGGFGGGMVGPGMPG